MSDLFELPESPLPPLEAARRRLDDALDYFNALTGDLPAQIKAANLVSEARHELTRLEQEALRK